MPPKKQVHWAYIAALIVSIGGAVGVSVKGVGWIWAATAEPAIRQEIEEVIKPHCDKQLVTEKMVADKLEAIDKRIQENQKRCASIMPN